MTTNNHTPIVPGAPANAATFNAPLSQLDTAISGVLGGAGVSSQQLKDWTEGVNFELTSITRDSDGVITSAVVKWPDGSSGVFTTTQKNILFTAIDAYTITHVTSGKTVTQAAVTRDPDGNVINKPVLTVA
jgi:hypothetical protein